MTIPSLRYASLALLVAVAFFPAWSAQGADLNPIAAAGPAHDPTSGPGAATCTGTSHTVQCSETIDPATLGLDGFAALANPPCPATEGKLTDLGSGYSLFQTAASKQFSADMGKAIDVVGLGGCAKGCGCAGCIGTDVLGYFVVVCGGCLACCDETNQTAECHCASPYIWQSSCSCTDPKVLGDVGPGLHLAVATAGEDSMGSPVVSFPSWVQVR